MRPMGDVPHAYGNSARGGAALRLVECPDYLWRLAVLSLCKAMFHEQLSWLGPYFTGTSSGCHALEAGVVAGIWQRR